MADGVAITQGSGTTVYTDDTGANGHAQFVKILDGTSGSVEPIEGDTNLGLSVNPKGRTTRVQVTPTVDTNIYASGDCLGGLMSIAGAASYSGGGGRILGVVVVDKTQAQRAAMDLYFYSQSVTMAGNNAAFAPSDADQLYMVGQVALGSWSYNTAFPGTPLNSVATAPPPASAATSVQSLVVPYVCAATTLYCQAVVRGTPTYTGASDLVFSFLIQPD